MLVDPRAIVIDPVNVRHGVPFDPIARGELIANMRAVGVSSLLERFPAEHRPDPTRLRHLSRLDVAYDPFPNQVSVPHRQPDQLGLSTGTDAVLLRTGDRHCATERRGRWSIATSWGLNTELTRIYALMIAIRDTDPCLRSHQQARVVYADRVAAARIS